ncbi:Type IV pilus biogenesis and competence protein PilQ [bacterium HR17]|uniref:Type IV pilus biogenesis and competence protein PilQ n=1 Tax=Candidatus Fervidibacter japonicus TaxID=2035412 RepID=A0A2H5XBY7_9BACT|nr:Type IV pilus biogenesis and competence protein PilQ [bacterium HR17]
MLQRGWRGAVLVAVAVGVTACGICAQTPKWTWHTVQSGETLSALARRYRTTVAQLVRLNGWKAPRPLRVGERVKVPAAAVKTVTVARPLAPQHPSPPTLRPASQMTAPVAARRGVASQPRVLQVAVGKAVALRVPGLRSVSVAMPEIADVQVLTADTLGVLGKKVGSTSLIVVTATQTFVWEVQVTPEPFLRERLQQLIGLPTVSVEVIKDAVVLSGTVPTQSDKERAAALARLFATTVLDLLRVEAEAAPPPPKPALPSPEEIQRAIGITGVRVQLVGDTVVLEGTVATPEEVTRAEKVAALMAPKVVNLLQARPLSASEVQALIAVPTVQVRETPEALVLEGTVPTPEDLNRINEIAAQARRKVVNWVKVVPPPTPPMAPFAQRVKDAIGIPTIEVQGDEKKLMLAGTVATQAEKERAIRIARFMLGLPPITPPPPSPQASLMAVPGFGIVPATSPAPTATAAAEQEPRLLDLIEVKGGKQIRVELRVVEVNRSALRDLGVNFPALASPGVAIGQAVNPETGGVTGIAQRTPIQALLQALEQRNAARTLSAPSAVVLSGQEARFNVGGEIPIPVSTLAPGVGTTTAIEFRPFGIAMTVVPTVEPSGKIGVRVNAEVSELDFSIGITIAGATIPGTRIRRATTQVELASGETLVMSGLVQRVQQEIVNRVPVLSRIPILGELFKSRRFQQGETELAILVTPVLVEPAQP